MRVRLKDLLPWLALEIEYPIDRDRLIARIGDIEIEAADVAESETLSAVVIRSGESTFHSSAELMDTVLCNLGDAYIGRKYYDDRGTNPLEQLNEGPIDRLDQSF